MRQLRDIIRANDELNECKVRLELNRNENIKSKIIMIGHIATVNDSVKSKINIGDNISEILAILSMLVVRKRCTRIQVLPIMDKITMMKN